MAARRRQQERRNRRSVRERIVDSMHATAGLGSGTAKVVRSIGRIRVAPHRVPLAGKEALNGLRRVAGIRHLVDQTITTTRRLRGRGSRRRTSRARANAANRSVGRGAESRIRTVRRAAPDQRHTAEAKPARARVRTRWTGERQTKPRQSVQSRDLKQRTIQELREQARKAGIKGRSSMTKDELIKALRGRR